MIFIYKKKDKYIKYREQFSICDYTKNVYTELYLLEG